MNRLLLRLILVIILLFTFSNCLGTETAVAMTEIDMTTAETGAVIVIKALTNP